MILQKLTAVGTDGSRVMLWFDDGTKMKVATRVVAERGLYQGMELREEDLAELQDTARRASAKELRRRLVRKGERPEDAEEAADWLRELGALDDEAMARRIAQRCVDRGYGPGRIRQELYQKGIPREYWEEALAMVPDMSGAIDRFVEQKLRGREPDQKELQRVIGALQRRGYGWEEIRSALGRYQEGLDPSFYD